MSTPCIIIIDDQEDKGTSWPHILKSSIQERTQKRVHVEPLCGGIISHSVTEIESRLKELCEKGYSPRGFLIDLVDTNTDDLEAGLKLLRALSENSLLKNFVKIIYTATYIDISEQMLLEAGAAKVLRRPKEGPHREFVDKVLDGFGLLDYTI